MERRPTKKDLESECRRLEDDCDALLDLIEDLLEECATQGCSHSADIRERVDEWLEPGDADDDVVEVIPES